VRTFLKIAGGVVFLVIAAVAAGFAVIANMDPNDFREFLTAEVKEATGRDLKIAGDLKVSVSLTPTVIANDVSLSNAAWGSRPDMVTLKRLETGLSLMPLLSGALVVTKIELVEPDILLETDDKGVGNWMFKPAAQTAEEEEADDGPGFLPVLQALQLSNGKFRYQDGRTKEVISLELPLVKIAEPEDGETTRLEVEGRYNDTPFAVAAVVGSLFDLPDDPESYPVTAEVDALGLEIGVKGTVDNPLSKRGLNLGVEITGKDLLASLAAVKKLGIELPDLALPPLGPLALKAKVTGTPEEIALSSLNLSLKSTDKLAATVKGSVKNLPAMPSLDLAVAAEGRDFSIFSGLAGRDLPTEPEYKVSAKIKGSQAALDVSDLDLLVKIADKFWLSANGNVGNLLGTPQATLSLATEGSDLTIFSKYVGQTLPKGRPYSVKATVSNPGTTYKMENLALSVGESKLSSSVTAETKGKVPDVNVSLTSSHLDLEDIQSMLPKEEKAAAPAAKQDDGRVFPADPLPVDGLKATNVSLKFLGEKLLLQGLTITDVSTGVSLKGGNLTVDTLQAQAFGGKLAGKLSLDGSKARPVLLADLDIAKLDLNQLMAQFGEEGLLEGKVDLSVNAKGAGASVREIMADLNGDTELVMHKGKIASKYVELLAADVVKVLMPGGKGGDETKINCLVNRYDIKNGIAKSTGLLFDTERISVIGDGQIDLRQEKLDLQIKPRPKDASLVSLSIDLDIGGTLASPSVKPSTASVLKGVAGLALVAVNPVAILAVTASSGSGDKNPCVAALDKASQQKADPGGAPPPQQKEEKPSNPVDAVTKGVGGALKSLFGK